MVVEAEEVMEVTEEAPTAVYPHGSTQLAMKNTARDKNNNNNSSNLILSLSQELLKRHHHKAKNLTTLRSSLPKKGAHQIWLTRMPPTTTPFKKENQPLEEHQ